MGLGASNGALASQHPAFDRCPACGHEPVVAQGCAVCGFVPATVDGFTAFAPELAHEGTGFDPAHFQVLAQLEAAHFWFQARNEWIVSALQRHFADARSFLEIGCGTGFVLQAVARALPHLALSGSELFVDGLSVAAERVPHAQLFQMDAARVPFRERFDVIGAFDVLEHVEDDVGALAGFARALTPGGGVVLSVPQHAWLWSAQDEHAHHVRRYAAQELTQLLEIAGFEILEQRSFVSLLLPALVASRLFAASTSASDDPYRELRLPGWLNRACRGVMRLEAGLSERGARLPFGSSRLVVARQRVAHASAQLLEGGT